MKKENHKLMKNVRKNVIERRLILGISQAMLAERSGLSQSIISLLEDGLRPDIQLNTLTKLAVGLECEVHNLLYGFNDPSL